MTYNIFLFRIFICFILSIIIGLERQYRHKIVGLRTNVLVSLGSFMFVVVSFNFINDDYTRIASQVVSGIGFLGGGVIICDGSKIKGLNTAATLWCVAAIGVLTASGMLFEASIGTLFILLSNIVLRYFSLKIMKSGYLQKELALIKIECNKLSENSLRNDLYKYLETNKLNLYSLEKNEIDNDMVRLNIKIVTKFSDSIMKLVNILSTNINIINISFNQSVIIKTNLEDDDSVD